MPEIPIYSHSGIPIAFPETRTAYGRMLFFDRNPLLFQM